VNSRTVNVGGKRVHYLFGGSEQNPAVVLLHGWAGKCQDHQELGQLLSRRFFVVIPDLPGFGKSQRTAAKYEEFVKLLNVFLAKIGISSATFVGHSLGGGVAIEMANLFPEKVTRLILVDSVGQRIDRSLRDWFRAAKENSAQDTAERPGESNWPFIRDCLKRLDWLWWTFRLIKNRDLLEEARRIKAPTFVIWGEEDKLLPDYSSLCSALGVEPIIIEGAGHDWILLEPETASRVIGELI
jgi:pimeloyl-ACP methyl ester carboxylesterase